MMKRHFEYLTQPDQTLKDRSRFWTWYMRGLHGDMDTRYEGDRRLSRDRIAALAPKASNESGFNFRPMASNTYGYHPKGVTHLSKPPSAPDTSLAVDKPRKDWSTPLKNLDDVMTLREPQPRSSSVPRSIGSRPLIPARHLRHLPIDADLEGLLTTDASEFRLPRCIEVEDAERALDKLRRFIGYVKPYDVTTINALHSLEMALLKASKFSVTK